MYKMLAILGSVAILAGCAASPMEQREYKARLDYCSKIQMTVQIEKNEKSRPTNVECIDEHGSTFESKLN
jgi:hypothetical protein